MPVSAAIIGGAGLIGGIGSALIGSNAATTAAQIQAQAAGQAEQLQATEAQNAENVQLGMFNTAQAAEQPYNTVGQGATQTLAGLYGINGAGAGTGTPSAASLNAFTSSPDYAFALQQGTQAMQRSAAAGGTLISGGQLKAGQEFGQGLATQQYGNYYNRLLSLAQLGQSAAGGIASAAGTAGGQVGNTLSNAGSQIGNSIQAAGQASASGVVGSSNAITGGLSSATSGLSTAALLSAIGPKLGANAASGNTSLSSYAPPVVQDGSFNAIDAAAA